MVKKLLMIASDAVYQHLTEEDYEYLHANDWIVDVVIDALTLYSAPNPLYNPVHTAKYLNMAQTIAAYDVPLMIDVEDAISYNFRQTDTDTTWYTGQASTLEDTFGGGLDYFEEQLGESLKGYYWEEMFLSVFDWFTAREKARGYKLIQGIGGVQVQFPTPNWATGNSGGPVPMSWYGTVNYVNGVWIHWDISWGVNEMIHRAENVDVMIPQLWFISMVPSTIEVDNYVRSYTPSVGRGYQTGLDYPGSYGDFSGYWTLNDSPWYTLTWEEQIEVMREQFTLIKQQASAPEYVQLQVYPDSVHPVSDFDAVVNEIIARPIPTSELELVNLAT